MKLKNNIKYAVASDFHIPYEDSTLINVFLQYCKKNNIKRLILNGDILDLTSISSYKKTEFPDLYNELSVSVGKINNVCKNFDEVIWVMGNHENRILKYIYQLEQLIRFFPTASKTVESLVTSCDMPVSNIIFYDTIFEQSIYPIQCGKLRILHGHELDIGGYVSIPDRIFKITYDHTLVGHWHKPAQSWFKALDGSIFGVWALGSFQKKSFKPINQWFCSFAVIESSKNNVYHVDHKLIINNQIY